MKRAPWKRCPLVILYAGVTAINRNGLTGNIAGLFSAKENSDRVELAGLTVSLHRNRLVSELLEVIGIQSLGRQFGVEVAGADGVNGDTGGSKLSISARP